MTDAIRPPVSDDDRLAWLRLTRSENVGPITFLQLMHQFGSAQASLAALPDLARRGGLKRQIKICIRTDAEREMAAGHAVGATLLALNDGIYSQALAHIDQPPVVLWSLGNPDHLRRSSVSIVGARNASAAGVRMARELATGIGKAGYTVVSGMARGIDTAAHAAALDQGTVAVLAGGVDDIYPAENKDLYARPKTEGCILSEMPMGMKPKRLHFPRRNRIISGLSLGVVVIEAAKRSGSLITSRFALEQGRDVFAVPGSPLDARCAGTNGLIKQGATLTENATDVVDALDARRESGLSEPEDQPFLPFAEPPKEPKEDDVSQARARVIELLGPTPTEINEMIRLADLTPQVVLMILLELELAGKLIRHPGQMVSLN